MDEQEKGRPAPAVPTQGVNTGGKDMPNPRVGDLAKVRALVDRLSRGFLPDDPVRKQ